MELDYRNMTDEELLLCQHDDKVRVTDYLMNKYKNLVRSKAKSMYILGADREDLIQEGMIGLFKAVRDYDNGRDASFATFADLCISRQMYTAVQASGRQKHIPLNTYISLYGGNKNKGEDADDGLMNCLVSRVDLNPEELVIDKENTENLAKKIEEELSPFENEVLDLYLTGMSYTQIARVLGRDEKSTDNALSRIRGKVKKLLSV